ncbi:MAG: carboxymuconolactone decarboxylase family protein [Alphaproteobacteria bacterium]|nr:carboxymuconolactone decarboxylase family protein [Alphaproteobacteria bacterium]
MARVPYPTADDLPQAERHIYERMARERGTGHIWRAIANAPKICDAMVSLAGALRNDITIEQRYRELGVLMVGLVSKSDYEFDHHWNSALAAGMPRAQLESLADFETSSHFTDQEKAVLRYSKEASGTGVVSDATWTALRAFFDNKQAMEIVLTVAWYNCVVRILLPLQIEHEPGFKRN